MKTFIIFILTGWVLTVKGTTLLAQATPILPALQASYCPHDKFIPVDIPLVEDVITAASPNGKRYTSASNYPSVMLSPSGNSILEGPSNGWYITRGSVDTLFINPYLLSYTAAGPGKFTIMLPYHVDNLTYNSSDPAHPTITPDVTQNFSFDFDVLQSAISFHLRESENVFKNFVCNNDVLELSATPSNGIFKINGSFSGLIFINNKVLLNPEFVTRSNIVTYEYGAGACSVLEAELEVLPLPSVSFTAQTACAEKATTFMPMADPDADLSGYQWEFGDGPAGPGKAGTPVSIESHTYQVAGFYNARLNYKKEFMIAPDVFKSCSNVYQQVVEVKEVPRVDFTWENVCEGLSTRFMGQISQPTSTKVKDISWDFGNGYASGNASASFQFPAIGKQNVKLKVTTDNLCEVEVVKEVFTVPVVQAHEYPSLQDFDGTNGGWVTGQSSAVSSSWVWNVPHGYILNGDAGGSGRAWFTKTTSPTNLNYNLNEKSWVHSPCFDMTTLVRPVLSLDIRSLTQEQLDGVVLQLDSTGQTDQETHWVTVGGLQQTSNWYDHVGIPGNPGNQLLTQLGWSGNKDVNGWRKAIIALDQYLPRLTENRKNIRFRIALGSQGTNLKKSLDGFAFDNFLIASRDRILLLESFTNTSLVAQNAEVDAFCFKPSTYERNDNLVKLEYHLNTPLPDKINQKKPSVHNARAAYYGIPNTLPKVILDGSIVQSPFSVNIVTAFNVASLAFSKIKIENLSAVQKSSGEVSVSMFAKILAPVSETARVRIVIAEKIVAVDGKTLRYVVRDALPDVAGIPLSAPNRGSNIVAIEAEWLPDHYLFADPQQLTLVAFVQDDDTHEIYGLSLLENFSFTPVTITANDPSVVTTTQTYPNPAHDYIQFKLRDVDKVSYQVFDVTGKRLDTNSVIDGEDLIIDTRKLVDGMYFLRMGGEQGAVQKFQVVH
jgi:hypothetical protein